MAQLKEDEWPAATEPTLPEKQEPEVSHAAGSQADPDVGTPREDDAERGERDRPAKAPGPHRP